MQTAEQREAAFRADFAALLAKHRAELTVTDDRKPWGLHSGIAVVYMPTERDADGKVIADYTEFNI